jgi:serine protease Do
MNYGWLRPGWVGMKIQQVTPEMALALGMPQAEGSIVTAVIPGGPAAKADLRPGDVILHIGKSAPTDERAILRAVATAPIGESIVLGVWRDGQEQSLKVSVKEWPRSQWEMLDVPVSMPAPVHGIAPDLGLTLEPLSDQNRAQYGAAAAPEGVLVTAVTSGSDAADRGLAAGDIIERIQDKAVSTTQQFADALAATRASKRKFALVLVQTKTGNKMGIVWMTLRIADG